MNAIDSRMSDAAVSKPQPWAGPAGGWRARLYTVIFESDTRAGLLFDQALLVLIVASLVVVVADSVETLNQRYDRLFTVLEWTFTVIFTVEYLARLACVRRPTRYAGSFFGVVDLLSVLPTWLALFFPQLHALIDVRVLRLLRVFRIFKLTAYLTEYHALGGALLASRRKILAFLSVVIMIVVIMGTIMYVVEGPANGFTSIPVAVYWAITTMTTVGFGDITPKTDLGRLIASLMMLLGWGTLAVPTGIVTSEMAAQRLAPADGPSRGGARTPWSAGDTADARRCSECGTEGHAPDASFCRHCGALLPSAGGALAGTP